MLYEHFYIFYSFYKAIDKANGYVFGSKEERNIQRLLSCAVGAEYDDEKYRENENLFSAEAMEEEEENILKMLATQNVNRMNS